jgi:hypothetical protein
MNEYPGYKNRATWVASICLGESIKQLRTDYPEMSVLDVKNECLEFLLNHSNHKFVNQFLYVVADEIDWDFLYNDDITRLVAKV